MLNFSVESKSQLAKLLATENIKIEHQNAPTASFNLETRTLVCPIWEDMSGQMYDLLLGHEVSHALETPKQGWHDAVCERGRNYKHFLNVVEDARIEKKIKRRYPGIRRSFIGAYNQLLEKDFFGIADTDVNDLFFIDRLNIYSKAGINSKVTFDDPEEKSLLKLVEDAETWNDVVYATDKIWDYSKQEQKQDEPTQASTPIMFDDDGDQFGEEYDDRENESGMDSEEEFESEANDTGDDEGEEEDSETDDSQGDDDSDDFDYDEPESSDELGDSQGDDDLDESYGEPECMSDKNFRKNEEKLLSAKVKAYNYVAIPQLKTKDMMMSTDRLAKLIEQYAENYNVDANKLYNEFKSKNEKYISLLAKEFEMRKAAKAHSRSKTSSTGDININKIYKYQLDDEIFRKATTVPKGKSHGLVLLLDMSGSMAKSMAGSIEQVQVLSAFCRKVNIPFTVYSFTSKPNLANNAEISDCFVQEDNVLKFNRFKLIELVSSKMKGSEFNKAIKNLCVLAKIYADSMHRNIPYELMLGRTPLVESMVTLNPIVKEFRKNNNLDLVNLVIVHDGDADAVLNYGSEGKEEQIIGSNYDQRYVLRDTKQKLDFPLDLDDSTRGEGVRKAIYEWFKQTTGTKIFGFFISDDSKYSINQSVTNQYYEFEGGRKNFDRYTDQYDYYESKAIQLKKEKLLISKNPGYDGFYIILGGKNLRIEDDELTVTGKVTVSKLYNSLRKMNKSKQVNRVLATQFIQGIAV